MSRGRRGGSRAAVNLSFLDRGRYFPYCFTLDIYGEYINRDTTDVASFSRNTLKMLSYGAPSPSNQIPSQPLN
jgi:hypothetical protein